MDIQEFDKAIKLHAKKVANENEALNEETTKHSLILPLFQLLGYDIFNRKEFISEVASGMGIKSTERVDYAIELNGKQVLIIEAKKFRMTLSSKQINQLYRYFTASDANIAILTNGDDYWFFSDNKKTNIMDTEPYLKIRMSELTKRDIEKLSKYSKEQLLNGENIKEITKPSRIQSKLLNILIDWVLEKLVYLFVILFSIFLVFGIIMKDQLQYAILAPISFVIALVNVYWIKRRK